MKFKLNRRLLRIGIGCLLVALVLTLYTFKQMEKLAQPEPTESIIYFVDSLPRGIVLNENDIKMKETPVSMIPIDAIKDKEILIDRELIVDVSKDEFALLNKTTVRGEIKEDLEEMWEIGIEVKELSDFLGSQIKVDEYYGLLFANPLTNEKYLINKVKITGLVDSTGNVILPNGEGLASVVLMAVETEEEMNKISSYKMQGQFELVRPPKDWEYTERTLDFGIIEAIDEQENLQDEELYTQENNQNIPEP